MKMLPIFEEDSSNNYKERTIKNASADVTIAFAINFGTSGEILTKNSVVDQGKFYIAIDAKNLNVTPERVNKLVKKLNKLENQEITLNIAGNGMYTMKGFYTQDQCDNFVFSLLKQTIEHPDLKLKIKSIRSGGQTGFDESGIKAAVKLGLPSYVLCPKGWRFRPLEGGDISNEELFKKRFICQEEMK